MIERKSQRFNTDSILSVNFSDRDAVTSSVKNLWDNRADIKFQLERNWYQQVLWYLGLQNHVYHHNVLKEPPKPPWRKRLVSNQLLAITQTLVSKIYKSPPNWDVLPSTTDQVDIQTSYVAQQLLRHNWYNMDCDEKTIEVLNWMSVCGNGFWQHVWDPNKGHPLVIPTEGGLELDEEELYVGETDIYVVPPFEMLIDPRAHKLRDASWAMRSYIADIDELQELYPNADIKSSRTSNFGNYIPFMEYIKNVSGNRTSDSVAGTVFTDKTNTTLVHQLWIKPRNAAKGSLRKGQLIVLVNDKIVQQQDFPYVHGELPFAHFYEIPVPGRLWGTCTLEQLMPLQADYNRTISQLLENRDLMSRPKWLVPHGARLGENSLTSEPGEIVEHTMGFEPKPFVPPPMPAYVERLSDRHKQDMEFISGIHEVSRAEAPGQIRSGRGVLALIEQDDSKINYLIQHVHQQFERIGRQNLAVSAQYIRETRMGKIVGDNDELLLFEYDGQSLLGNRSGLPGVSTFDVRVKTIAGMPNSRAAGQQLIDMMLERGLLNPAQSEKDKRLALKMLQVGDISNSIDQSRMHRSRQLQEIQQMTRGEYVQPRQFNDHKVHLEVLDEFRNSARYDILPNEIKALLDQHAYEHKQLMAQLAIEPQIMLRTAALAMTQTEQMNEMAQQAQGPAGNVLGPEGAQGGPAPSQTVIQAANGQATPRSEGYGQELR